MKHLNSKLQMRSTKFLSVGLPLCLVIFFVSLIYPLPFDVRTAHFYKLEGKSFNGSSLERHLARDFWDCLFLCINAVKKNCFSFNFGGIQAQDLQECELSNSERKLEPIRIKDRQGFSYYGMTGEVRSCSSTFSLLLLNGSNSVFKHRIYDGPFSHIYETHLQGIHGCCI